MRENTGEKEAAQIRPRLSLGQKIELPQLIDYGDLRGDLQVQTDWTDGENSIEEMAEAAMDSGLEYIGITDHTKTLVMTGGSDEKKLLKQMAAIDEINRKLKVKSLKFKILK